MNKFQKLYKSHLFENYMSLMVIQGLNYLLPLITIPFLYNQLGNENYGLVNFSFAFIQYFIMLTDFGFGLSGTRYIAANRDDKEKVNRFLNSACLSRLFMSLLSFVIVVGCILFVPVFSSHKIFTLLFFGQVIGNAMNPSWFFQGMERMKFNTILHVTTRLISILPLFVIVKEPGDYLYIPICYSGGSIIAGILSLSFIRKTFDMKFYFTSFNEIKTATIDSLRYFLSRVSNSVFTNTNTFILGLACGNAAVGYYSLADKIHTAVDSAYGPVNGTLFPYMTKNRNLKLMKKVIIFGAIFNTLAIIILMLLLDWICPLLFKSFAPESMAVLRILLIGNIFGFVNTFLGYPFLAAWGHPNFCNYSLITISVFHLIGLLILYLLDSVTIINVAMLAVLGSIIHFIIRSYGVIKYNLWNQQ